MTGVCTGEHFSVLMGPSSSGSFRVPGQIRCADHVLEMGVQQLNILIGKVWCLNTRIVGGQASSRLLTGQNSMADAHQPPRSASQAIQAMKPVHGSPIDGP